MLCLLKNEINKHSYFLKHLGTKNTASPPRSANLDIYIFFLTFPEFSIQADYKEVAVGENVGRNADVWTGAHCCELAPMLSGPVTLSWIVRHRRIGNERIEGTHVKYTSTFRLLSARLSRPRCRSTGNCLCPGGAPLRYLMRRTIAPNLVYVRYERGIRNPAEPILPLEPP